jgi:hypothetical protein
MGPVKPVKNINMLMKRKENASQTAARHFLKYYLWMEHAKLVRIILMPMMNKDNAKLIHARVQARFYN